MEIFTINTSHQNIPYPTKGSVVLRTPIFIKHSRSVVARWRTHLGRARTLRSFILV